MVRQTYKCGKDIVTIQYEFNKFRLITNLKEIGSDDTLEENELNLPTIEVTSEYFNKIINHPKLM
jgi:hypothetical protein